MGMRGVFDERYVTDVTQQMRDAFITATGIDPMALDVHNYTHPLVNLSLPFIFRYPSLLLSQSTHFFEALSFSLFLKLLCGHIFTLLSPLVSHG